MFDLVFPCFAELFAHLLLGCRLACLARGFSLQFRPHVDSAKTIHQPLNIYACHQGVSDKPEQTRTLMYVKSWFTSNWPSQITLNEGLSHVTLLPRWLLCAEFVSSSSFLRGRQQKNTFQQASKVGFTGTGRFSTTWLR